MVQTNIFTHFMDVNTTSDIALKALQNLQQLKPQVHFVCFQWQDVPGLLRGNIVPIGYALQLATVKKHIWLSPVGLHRAVDNSFIPWLDLRGMHCLVAD